MKNILKINNTHKHEQFETVKIQIQEIRYKRKRRAFNNIHETLQKIIRKEMSSIENNTIIVNNDVSLMRKSMYYEHRKFLSKLQKSVVL